MTKSTRKTRVLLCRFLLIFDLYKEKCCKNTDDMLFVNRVLVFFWCERGIMFASKNKKKLQEKDRISYCEKYDAVQ